MANQLNVAIKLKNLRNIFKFLIIFLRRNHVKIWRSDFTRYGYDFTRYGMILQGFYKVWLGMVPLCVFAYSSAWVSSTFS